MPRWDQKNISRHISDTISREDETTTRVIFMAVELMPQL